MVAILFTYLLFASPAEANSLKSVKECLTWMKSIQRTMTDQERAADLAKNHAGDEIDSAHDLEKNDPSNPKTELALTEYFPQNKVALFGVEPHINKNIKTAFKRKYKEFPSDPKKVQKILNDPESKALLGMHADRYEPKVINGPLSVNSNTEFCGISDRSHGYCKGFAAILRRFHTLAFYDETLPRLATTAENMLLMDKVIAGKATVIPGYANLETFLKSDPQLELYYKLNTMAEWKAGSVRWKMIPILWNASKPMKVEQQLAFVADLEARLARHEMPQIIFSASIPSAPIMGLNTDIHVVLANGVEKLANGNTRINIWDINFYAKSLIKEPKFLEITPDHKIHYAPWYDPKVKYADQSDLISRVQYVPENDVETVSFIRELKEFCKKSPQYCQKYLDAMGHSGSTR